MRFFNSQQTKELIKKQIFYFENKIKYTLIKNEKSLLQFQNLLNENYIFALENDWVNEECIMYILNRVHGIYLKTKNLQNSSPDIKGMKIFIEYNDDFIYNFNRTNHNLRYFLKDYDVSEGFFYTDVIQDEEIEWDYKFLNSMSFGGDCGYIFYQAKNEEKYNMLIQYFLIMSIGNYEEQIRNLELNNWKPSDAI